MKKDRVKKEFEYWPEAVKFVESVLPKDYDKQVVDFCKKHKFSHNERLLFRSMIEKAMDFKTMMAILMSECK